MPDFTVADVLSDRIRVNAEARAALIAFKRSKPWRGTVDERRVKFETLCTGLAGAYGLPVPTLRLCMIDTLAAGQIGNGGFNPDRNTIVMVGRLSVVTFLHCLARARGKNHREACAWSLSVFKRFFPISFSRCRQVGFMLLRA